MTAFGGKGRRSNLDPILVERVRAGLVKTSAALVGKQPRNGNRRFGNNAVKVHNQLFRNPRVGVRPELRVRSIVDAGNTKALALNGNVVRGSLGQGMVGVNLSTGNGEPAPVSMTLFVVMLPETPAPPATSVGSPMESVNVGASATASTSTATVASVVAVPPCFPSPSPPPSAKSSRRCPWAA